LKKGRNIQDNSTAKVPDIACMSITAPHLPSIRNVIEALRPRAAGCVSSPSGAGADGRVESALVQLGRARVVAQGKLLGHKPSKAEIEASKALLGPAEAGGAGNSATKSRRLVVLRGWAAAGLGQVPQAREAFEQTLELKGGAPGKSCALAWLGLASVSERAEEQRDCLRKAWVAALDSP
jgi:hypothetical protein